MYASGLFYVITVDIVHAALIMDVWLEVLSEGDIYQSYCVCVWKYMLNIIFSKQDLYFIGLY